MMRLWRNKVKENASLLKLEMRWNEQKLLIEFIIRSHDGMCNPSLFFGIVERCVFNQPSNFEDFFLRVSYCKISIFHLANFMLNRFPPQHTHTNIRVYHPHTRRFDDRTKCSATKYYWISKLIVRFHSSVIFSWEWNKIFTKQSNEWAREGEWEWERGEPQNESF